MKLFGTKRNEISLYPLDCFSFLHIISGIIFYLIGFWLFSIFMLGILAIFLTYICLFLGGIVWEIAENTILIDAKMFEQYDTPLNSQVDVLLVFLGGIIGCYCYILNWMFTIILIGSLFVAFIVSKVLTLKNLKKTKKKTKNKNPSKKPKNG